MLIAGLAGAAFGAPIGAGVGICVVLLHDRAAELRRRRATIVG